MEYSVGSSKSSTRNLPHEALNAARTLQHHQVNTNQNEPLPTTGDIRLMQAYLRVMGFFGNPDVVRGSDIVSGNLNERTVHACEQFMRSQHRTCSLDTREEIAAVIASLRKIAHTHATTIISQDNSLHERTVLSRMFHASPAHKRYPELHTLHPQMRFPLAAALDSLKRQGITVVLHEGCRSPQQQEALVEKGLSTAPPYWSFHGFCLAVDITPREREASQVLNPTTDQWKTIMNVMRAHGFDSMYQLQGWDLPHFELPAKTSAVRSWPIGHDGFKDIPDAAIPKAWRSINARIILQSENERHQTAKPPRAHGAGTGR